LPRAGTIRSPRPEYGQEYADAQAEVVEQTLARALAADAARQG